VIWNRNVTTVAGMNQVVWDGMSRQGQGVGTGIYVVRMALIDANGKAIQRLDRKIPLTRNQNTGLFSKKPPGFRGAFFVCPFPGTCFDPG
jgi:hypothetical protein